MLDNYRLEKLQELKTELQILLAQDNTDYERILILSNEIAKLDSDNVRFTVDSAHINRLGKELVGRQETAVAELVKNAYDADATFVNLTFNHSYYANGTLTIKDNGIGMTRQELIDGFMRISSTDKIHHPTSEKYGRQRAGRKGIGRFAVQNLGKKLTIITQSEKEDEEPLKVTIDWSKFSGDSELIAISNKIEVFDQIIEPGTELIIEGLNDSWSDATIQRVYRYVSDLIHPYAVIGPQENSEKDPGFQANFFRSDDEDIWAIADNEDMIFSHALAKIEAIIDDQGNVSWGYESEYFGEEQNLEYGQYFEKHVDAIKYLKNVKINAYYFIVDQEYVPRNDYNRLQKLLRDYGGIRLYRNGFRVPPYGDKDNDWLGLDYSYARRYYLPPHSTSNFFGSVEVYDPNGEIFDEKASREGLINENREELEELKRFVYDILISVALRIATFRHRKKTTGQQSWQEKEKVSETLRELAEEVKQYQERTKQSDDQQFDGEKNEDHKTEDKNFYERIYEQLNYKANQEEERERKEITEKEMLQVLAGIGLSIGLFTHEVRHFSSNMEPLLQVLKKRIEQTGEARLIEPYDSLQDYFRIMMAFAGYFGDAIADNIKRDITPLKLNEVVKKFYQNVADLLERKKILFSIKKEFGIMTPPMHESEIVSILLNLMTNSIKAINRCHNSKRMIEIETAQDEQNIIIYFKDTGDGIPIGMEDEIFMPFYTTTRPPSARESESTEIMGTGLGLYIVRNIVESLKGRITVKEPSDEFSTCFKITFPKEGK